MFSLEKKTVLITGAAGGIGSETARICAGMGANLILTDLVCPEDLMEGLRGQGRPVRFLPFDVTDRKEVEHAIEGIGRLDVLVANAGHCPWDDWEDQDWDSVFQRVIDINLLGLMHITRATLRKMRDDGGGRMVLVSSVAARMGGLAASPHYVAAKGGGTLFCEVAGAPGCSS
ncbi:SDR family NAD(P)-dependent oxidoreductase [Castellaniella sp. WN]